MGVNGLQFGAGRISWWASWGWKGFEAGACVGHTPGLDGKYV